MNKFIEILGAGELGKQIANFALNDNHYNKVCFYDDFNIGEEIKGNTDDLITPFSLSAGAFMVNNSPLVPFKGK